MLKRHQNTTGRLLASVLATAVCFPLVGCMSEEDPWGEGSMVYTVDEMYPIAEKRPCGQDWPDLGNDPSNHLSPNHGCAVHYNIAEMVSDPTVLKKPKRRPRTTAAVTATTAITNMEANAASSTATSNGSKVSTINSGGTP
jgi:hypothetical protein